MYSPEDKMENNSLTIKHLRVVQASLAVYNNLEVKDVIKKMADQSISYLDRDNYEDELKLLTPKSVITLFAHRRYQQSSDKRDELLKVYEEITKDAISELEQKMQITTKDLSITSPGRPH